MRRAFRRAHGQLSPAARRWRDDENGARRPPSRRRSSPPATQRLSRRRRRLIFLKQLPATHHADTDISPAADYFDDQLRHDNAHAAIRRQPSITDDKMAFWATALLKIYFLTLTAGDYGQKPSYLMRKWSTLTRKYGELIWRFLGQPIVEIGRCQRQRQAILRRQPATTGRQRGFKRRQLSIRAAERLLLSRRRLLLFVSRAGAGAAPAAGVIYDARRRRYFRDALESLRPIILSRC